MDSRYLKNILGVARAPFLSLSVVTSILIWSIAFFQTGLPSFVDSFLILIALVAAHIGVNAHNECQDFESGLDDRTKKTLFSGGSGTLPESPEFLETARMMAWSSIALAVVIGLYFVLTVGIELLPIGVLGLWIVLNYTQKINRQPWLCLIAPGLAIGTLASLGGVYILSGYISLVALVIVLGFSLLLNNLLLLNQFPDIEADRTVGRNHLWIRYGTQFSLSMFRFQWLLAFALVVTLVLVGALPWYAMFLLAIAWLLKPLWVHTNNEQALSENLISALGKNVMLCHFYPLFLSLVLVLGSL